MMKKEKQKLSLKVIEPISIDKNIENINALWKSNISVVQRASIEPRMHSYLKMFITHIKENKDTDNILLRALSYLSLENDIINDNMGIFGIADDLHIINYAYEKVFGKKIIIGICLKNYI